MNTVRLCFLVCSLVIAALGQDVTPNAPPQQQSSSSGQLSSSSSSSPSSQQYSISDIIKLLNDQSYKIESAFAQAYQQAQQQPQSQSSSSIAGQDGNGIDDNVDPTMMMNNMNDDNNGIDNQFDDMVMDNGDNNGVEYRVMYVGDIPSSYDDPSMMDMMGSPFIPFSDLPFTSYGPSPSYDNYDDSYTGYDDPYGYPDIGINYDEWNSLPSISQYYAGVPQFSPSISSRIVNLAGASFDNDPYGGVEYMPDGMADASSSNKDTAGIDLLSLLADTASDDEYCSLIGKVTGCSLKSKSDKCERCATRGTVDVDGEASISLVTNMTRIQLGVEFQGTNTTSAADVFSEVSSRSERVVAILQNDPRVTELTTTAITLSKDYQWVNNQNTFMGYRATNMVEFLLAGTNSGGIIDACVRAGATRIDSISFEAPPAVVMSARRQVLVKALKDAREKGMLIADTLGINLLIPPRIDLYHVTAPPSTKAFGGMNFARAEMDMMPAMAPMPSAPLLPGKQVIQATIRVAFEFTSAGTNDLLPRPKENEPI